MKKLILTLAVACATTLVVARTITVTSTADEYPTGPEGSLRAALAAAEDGDTITFDTSLAGGTINIVTVPTAHEDSSLVVDKSVTIQGPEGGIVIDGGWNKVAASDTGGRIFLIKEGLSKVVFNNVTMRRGHSRPWGAYNNLFVQGGAVGAYSPVRFEDCAFVENAGCDINVNWIPAGRGGGAIYAEADVELVFCRLEGNSIPAGSVSYGGAIYMAQGALVARNCVFDSNYSRSFCGGIRMAPDATSVLLEDCLVEHGYCPGGNGVHAGFMWANMSNVAGKFIRFNRCAFRDNYLETAGGFGGALYAESAVPVTITDCEFSECRTGNGGAVRSHGNPTVYVNCTFTGGASRDDSWGPALDIRNTTYLVNCTFGGNVFLDMRNSGGGSAIALGNPTTLLNCVLAYNYRNVGDGATGDILTNSDIGKFSSSWTCVNTIANGVDAKGVPITLASKLDVVDSASKIFADYRSVDSVKFFGTTAALRQSLVFPELASDDNGKYRSRVFAPAKGGLLDGTGWLVKANADYTHICYSSDGGGTWTDLYKNGTPDDSTLAPITADQRGVPYKNGVPPIGAATVAETSASGLQIFIR